MPSAFTDCTVEPHVWIISQAKLVEAALAKLYDRLYAEQCGENYAAANDFFERRHTLKAAVGEVFGAAKPLKDIIANPIFKIECCGVPTRRYQVYNE